MCYSDWTQLSVSRTWPMNLCTAPIQFSPNWIILSSSFVNLLHDNPTTFSACVCVSTHALFLIYSYAVWINEQTNDENKTQTDINLLSYLSNHSGREVDVLPVWRLHPAGGAADAEHHGGVWLAHLLHRHIKVPGIPGVYQYFENDSGQQVGSAECLFPTFYFQFIFQFLLHQQSLLFLNPSDSTKTLMLGNHIVPDS